MAVNLTQYLPKPFEMIAGEWTITSPVPTVATGKIIAAFQARQAEQFRRTQAGEPPLVDEPIEGWPDTLEGLARMLLGDAEYERLADGGCPLDYIVNAATAALIYWANGGSEDAVIGYHEQLRQIAADGEQGARPKAKTRRPSKSGRTTA